MLDFCPVKKALRKPKEMMFEKIFLAKVRAYGLDHLVFSIRN